jgi:hypothetical protein
VGERIVPNVVKERRRSDDGLLLFADRYRVAGLAKERQGASREMVRAKSVLESRVRSAGIYQVRPAKLTHVTQALENLGVYELERQLIDSNVIPDRVAQDLESHARASVWGPRYCFGPAFLIAVSTSPNFSKFSRNIPASFFA